jgi:hypothetical protein
MALMDSPDTPLNPMAVIVRIPERGTLRDAFGALACTVKRVIGGMRVREAGGSRSSIAFNNRNEIERQYG